ncbi:MAG: hypothetical protein AUJ55_11240 [Proteobacteria bacterium CG1_02_64_396]|nr:MAG: hypothetical protein AUJ55_11240 [Proteobacteria bacterium CG1_02_64_396]
MDRLPAGAVGRSQVRQTPRIGVTLDYFPEGYGGFSPVAWQALRVNYFTALYTVGLLPVAIPLLPQQAVGAMIDELDALVISGGDFDIPPRYYGKEEEPGLGRVAEPRTVWEWGLLHEALGRDLPILGICGGMQLLNVACGGTLIQDLPTVGNMGHQQQNPRCEPHHAMRWREDSPWSGEVWQVNSTHHQAVDEVGPGLQVWGSAEDGIVEAIAALDGDLLGVQWHPEYLFEAGIEGGVLAFWADRVRKSLG